MDRHRFQRATTALRSDRTSARTVAIAIVLAVVAGLFGVNVASAVVVGGGTIGGFENDGNLTSNGTLDWTEVSPTIVIDDTADSGFQGSSKEEDPNNWTCNTGGADPPKGNIIRAYVSPRIEADSAFLDLAYVRQEGNGDAHVNFEFNQNPSPAPNGGDCRITRVAGDVLFTYDFAGGSDPADVRAWEWGGSQWVELPLTTSDAKAATNDSLLRDDPLVAGTQPIGAREFGEATVDLQAAGLDGRFLGCPGFGYVNVRSRSSHSITSALQDRLPTTPVDLSTCGEIIIHKVDDHDPPQPLAGAEFGLFDSANASGNPAQTCTTGTDGSCTFTDVAPGDWWVTELKAPANHDPDPRIEGPIHVRFRETVDVDRPFVNPRHTGSIRIHKALRDETGAAVTPDPVSSLDGTSFLVYRDLNADNSYDAGEEATLWPSEKTTAECTITNGLGFCDVGPLPTGDYRITETSWPEGTTPTGDVGVTVVKGTDATPVEVVYTNSLSPIDIAIEKAGPALVHVGDTFTYTFDVATSGPRLHGITLTELNPDRCTTPIDGPTKTGGDQDTFLEVGEVWSYTCDHTVTASDPDPLDNEARVDGTDDFGRDVSDTDTHRVDILNPAIEIVKTGTDRAHEGDTVSYSFAVTNTGDVDLTDVSVDDDKLGHIGTAATLTVGASTTLTKTTTAPSDDVTNVAEVCGTDPLAREVCDDDDHTLDVIHPAIEVVKTGTDRAHEGDTVSYSFAVTNTGDVDLTDVTVDDDKLGHIGTVATLAVGETQTLTRDSVAPGVDVTNTAIACGDDPLSLEVCDSDDHTLDVIAPAIEVVKSGPAQAHEGDAVAYTFKVTNTGDVDLTDVTVDDDKLGHIGAVATLAVGASTTLTKTAVAPASDVRNVATACGDDPLDAEVCDDDDHDLDIIHPGIDVEKSGPALAHEGDVVTYTFAVTNTGDVPLLGVNITDDVIGAIGTLTSLGVGQTTELAQTFTVPVTTADVVNTVEACGSDALLREYCDTDDHTLDVIHPAITLDKQVNGADHKPVSEALVAHEGDALGYTVVITNTGDTPLAVSALADTQRAGFVDDCSAGVGDSLGVGESTTCTYTSGAPGDDVHNVASVEAVDALGGPKGTVAASDETFVDVIHPAIEVAKDGPALAHEDDTVTYTFVVANTGDVDLVDVEVTDDVLGDVGTVDALAVGESATLSKDFVVPADTDSLDNTATACGIDPLDAEVCDDDPHTGTVIHPAVSIVKTASLADGPPRDVTFTYVVTNTGDVTLSPLTVTDDILGGIGVIPSLDAGESATLTRTVSVDATSPVRNIGTVVGVDPLGATVTASDDAVISVVLGTTVTRLPRTGAPIRTATEAAALLIWFGAMLLHTQSRLRLRRIAS